MAYYNCIRYISFKIFHTVKKEKIKKKTYKECTCYPELRQPTAFQERIKGDSDNVSVTVTQKLNISNLGYAPTSLYI